jgi:hypothetical protein
MRAGDGIRQSAFLSGGPMPLIYQGEDDQGIIWIVDQKTDKTIVMLACSRQSPTATGVPPDTDDPGRIYPMFDQAATSVIINVTGLPPGLQRFDSAPFVARASESARRREEVRLDEGRGEEWGLQRDEGIGLGPQVEW